MENIFYIVSGLVLLVLGGNWLLKAAVGLSLKLNIPKAVIGMTVVSFATSAPELIVSVKSALDGATGLAVGNVIGSNIANIGLVLGITIVLSTIKVEKSFYNTDWPAMIIASVLFYVFIKDNTIDFYEGAIMFLVLIVFLVYLLYFQKKVVVDEVSTKEEFPIYKIILFFGIGGFGLWAGSELLVNGATTLAKEQNVSDAIIGVTIVSVGTSIPELAASIIAVLKKEKAISLGNLIGSNIFNILAVLGITAMIKPIEIQGLDASLINNDIYWMLAISVFILPLILVPKYMRLGWREGILLLGAYIVFVYQVIPN